MSGPWQARWYGGAVAQPRRAEVHLDAAELVLVDRESGRSAILPLAATRIVGGGPDEVRLAVRGRATSIGGAGARLVVEGAEAGRALRPAIAHARPPLHRRVAWGAVRRVALGMAVTLGLVLGWVPFADWLADRLPREAEARLGERALELIVGDKAVCTRKTGVEAIEAILTDLLPHTKLPSRPRLTVVDSFGANAFALPGNQIVMLRGVTFWARDTEQLAAVVAHELGHLEARHIVRRYVRAAGPILVGSTLFGPGVANAVASMVARSAYSREAEFEADAIGARILVGAGYGNFGMAAMFDRMALRWVDARGWRRHLFASHPQPHARSEALGRLQDGATLDTAAASERSQRYLDFTRICDQTSSGPPSRTPSPTPPR